MTDTGHARLGFSGADRWLTCPGSAALSDGQPNDSSAYADWGTAAHKVAEWVLSQDLQSASGFEGRRVDLDTRTIEVDQEMIECVDAYVLAVRSFVPEGSQTWVELALPIGHIVAEPGATSTADFVALTPDGELQVHDLKGGRGVAVSAENNAQLAGYAVAAHDWFSLTDEVKSVRVFIHQPRLDSCTDAVYTLEELDEWRKRFREGVAKVQAADRFRSRMDEARWADTYLKTSEKGCRFCRAKADCIAYDRQMKGAIMGKAAAANDFEDLTEADVVKATEALSLASPEALARRLELVDSVEDWCRAVRAKALAKLIAGEPVPGFKLVRGKAGARRWADVDKAEAMLKGFRLKLEELYTKKLISPTQAEKLAKAGTIGERQWKKLLESGLIEQPEGSLSIDVENSKKPAVTVAAAPEDFEDLDAGGLA